jgi:hypothetical protein
MMRDFDMRELTAQEIKEIVYAEYLFAKVMGRPASFDEARKLKEGALKKLRQENEIDEPKES